MTHIKTLGIDLGKTSFHVIGWDEQERQVNRGLGSSLAMCIMRFDYVCFYHKVPL